MDDTLSRYKRAADQLGEKIRKVAADQWTNATPCAEWDVRALVNHLVAETYWIAPLFEGKTIAEVGDRYDGDVLGDDPVAAWDDSLASALAQIERPGAMQRTVHLSFGDFEGEEYLNQLLLDLVVHGWDLAIGISADPTIDPTLAGPVLEWFLPNAEGWRKAGALGPAVEVPADADAATRLIGLSGRQP